MSVREIVAGMLVVVAGAAFAACDDDAKLSLAGEAALATAQFWQQEASAGVLPEGTLVEQRGTREVVELGLPEDPPEGADARFCVEFTYIRAMTPFDAHTRVYVSTLVDKAWMVEVEQADGTCEGVS